jgi:hypothetical protein
MGGIDEGWLEHKLLQSRMPGAGMRGHGRMSWTGAKEAARRDTTEL